MIENKLIAVVVPAYNEEQQISVVIDTMPSFVDRIVIVNDCSKDKAADVVKKYISEDTIKTVNIQKNPAEIAPTFLIVQTLLNWKCYRRKNSITLSMKYIMIMTKIELF